MYGYVRNWRVTHLHYLLLGAGDIATGAAVLTGAEVAGLQRVHALHYGLDVEGELGDGPQAESTAPRVRTRDYATARHLQQQQASTPREPAAAGRARGPRPSYWPLAAAAGGPRSLDRSRRPPSAGRCYGTQLHTILVHGTLERTIEEKGSLYESYVLNPLRHGVLRDLNTNFRIDSPFQ